MSLIYHYFGIVIDQEIDASGHGKYFCWWINSVGKHYLTICVINVHLTEKITIKTYVDPHYLTENGISIFCKKLIYQ